MFRLHPKYITDPTGKKMVILPLQEFEKIMDELEEMEAVKLYDQAKKDTEPSIPIDEAFALIEANRKNKK